MSTRGRNYVLNATLVPDGFPRTTDLVGRALRFRYASGHTFEQHYQTESQLLWKGVDGPLSGYVQFDDYHIFKVSPEIYFVTWIEETTVPETRADQQEGPWMTNVVVDLGSKRAMSSWTGPLKGGGVEHVMDHATIDFVPCDLKMQRPETRRE